jgi:hypothetical protein
VYMETLALPFPNPKKKKKKLVVANLDAHELLGTYLTESRKVVFISKYVLISL